MNTQPDWLQYLVLLGLLVQLFVLLSELFSEFVNLLSLS